MSESSEQIIFTGRISNRVLFAVVDGKRRFHEDPAGIAFSPGLIEAAAMDNVRSVVVLDTSEDVMYKVALRDFRKLCRYLHDGRERWVLEMKYWIREVWEQPPLFDRPVDGLQ